MSGDAKQERSRKHPVVREHPEQRRQEETGREDPTEPQDVGRPPSEKSGQKKDERAA